jgi:hypothetical protein
MPMPPLTAIATGFADAIGAAYNRTLDQLLVVDCGNNTIVSVTVHTHAKSVVGTGYSVLIDLALSADGLHAYVVDGDTLLRLSLTNLNRAAATLVASGLGVNVDQLGLDEAHGYAYVVGGPDLKRINLDTGVVTTVMTGLGNTRGLLPTRDGRFIYVSGDYGEIRRIDLQSNTSVTLASGLIGPRRLAFSDAGESVILFPVVGGSLMKLDLTTTPATVGGVVGPTAANPYAVAVISPEHMVVICASELDEAYLTGGVYSAAGPILLGIGFVPADTTHIVGGYADTHLDTTYFFQVRNCPFGGTLPLMINHDGARNKGAKFYQVQVTPAGGVPQTLTQPYTDYLWNTALNRFDATPIIPSGGFYPVHAAGAIWLNYWLGMLYDTTGLPNGLVTVQVRLFSAASLANEIGLATDAGRSATLMIDNSHPTASLNAIWHDGATVGTCGIVTSGTPNFTFDITATAPRHLLGWSLTSYWGDNKSALVAADNYSAHVAGGPLWTGLTATVVPSPAWNCTVAGDPTSTRCGHSFFLYAWDRVINGWGYVHGAAGYQKTITILL